MIRSSSRGCGTFVGLRITCRVRASLAELRSQIRSRLRASCSRFLTVLNGSSRNPQISSYEKSLRYLSAISARSDSGKALMAFSRSCRSSESRVSPVEGSGRSDKRRVNRNGHQTCSPRDPRAFRTHDRSQPTPEGLGFAQVVPVQPRAQERRLGGIFGAGVVSQERIGVCGRGTVVSPDEFTERLSGLGVRDRPADGVVGGVAHSGSQSIVLYRAPNPRQGYHAPGGMTSSVQLGLRMTTISGSAPMSCTGLTFLTAASGLALGTRLAASTTKGPTTGVGSASSGALRPDLLPDALARRRPDEGKGLRPRSQNRGDPRRRFGAAREGAVAGRDPLRARASGWPDSR